MSVHDVWVFFVVAIVCSPAYVGSIQVFQQNEGPALTLDTCVPFKPENMVPFNVSNSDHGSITIIDVSQCNLTSLNLSEFPQSPKILKLNYRGNQLASAPDYPTFPSLEEINGAENILKYIHAGAFDGVKNLLELDYNNNLLTGIAINAFETLTSLKYLIINDNRLTSITTQFRSLENLAELHLEFNELTELSGAMLEKNANLEYINMNSNLLRELPGDLLMRNSKLTYFCCHNNRISAIPQKFFANNSDLQRAHFNHNLITAVDELALSGLPKLVYAPLQQNPLICECDEGTLNNLITCISCEDQVSMRKNGTVYECKHFGLSAFGDEVVSDMLSDSLNIPYYLNETTVVRDLEAFDKSMLFQNYALNDSNSIRFSIEFKGPSPGTEVYANSETGNIAITPRAEGSFVAELFASDAAQARAQVTTFNLVVTKRAPFNRSSNINCLGELSRYEEDANQHQYYVGQTYVVNGFKNCSRNDMFVNPANNDFRKIFYHLQWLGVETPSETDDNFINSQNAKLSISPGAQGDFTAQLRASDESGSTIDLLSWNVSVAEPIPDEASRENTSATLLSTLSVVAGISLGILIWLGIRARHKHIAKHTPHDFEEDLEGLPSIIPRLSINNQEKQIPTELPRSRIALGVVLGQGAFGTVRKALYRPPDSSNIPQFEVAVKQLSHDPSYQERHDMYRESAITAQFNHKNVIGMIGVVTTGSPLLLVLQYCSKGSLHNVLSDASEAVTIAVNVPVEEGTRISKGSKLKGAIENLLETQASIERDNNGFSISAQRTQTRLVHISKLEWDTIFAYCIGIADGMAYLSSRGFVHRDVAARNVLVDSADTPKVSDFGLSRDLESADYYKMSSHDTKLPLRWAAPECIRSQKFSEKSDVWSFGITVIECWTGAETPYRGWMNSFVVEQVDNGYVLPKPYDCPDVVYDNIICPCLVYDSCDRPTFEAIYQALAKMGTLFGPLSQKAGSSRESFDLGESSISTARHISEGMTEKGMTESHVSIVRPVYVKHNSSTLDQSSGTVSKEPGYLVPNQVRSSSIQSWNETIDCLESAVAVSPASHKLPKDAPRAYFNDASVGEDGYTILLGKGPERMQSKAAGLTGKRQRGSGVDENGYTMFETSTNHIQETIYPAGSSMKQLTPPTSDVGGLLDTSKAGIALKSLALEQDSYHTTTLV